MDGRQRADEARSDIEEISNATKGSTFELSSDSTGIADAITDDMDEVLSKIDLSIKAISGKSFVSAVTPTSFKDVEPGESVVFNVRLKGALGWNPLKKNSYNIYLWIQGNESALMKRVNIPLYIKEPVVMATHKNDSE